MSEGVKISDERMALIAGRIGKIEKTPIVGYESYRDESGKLQIYNGDSNNGY